MKHQVFQYRSRLSHRMIYGAVSLTRSWHRRRAQGYRGIVIEALTRSPGDPEESESSEYYTSGHAWTDTGHGNGERTAMLRDDRSDEGGRRRSPRNVLGEPIDICSTNPMTGFYRDGCCNTGREDVGSHTVCAVMTSAFLEFSKSRGNDLSTPVPEFGFPGLKAGDRWCLCAPRCGGKR